MSWHLGRLAAFDLETTGPDPWTARIVTAAVIAIRPQRGQHAADDPARWLTIDRYGWTADPGVDIPAEATAVHGITTERAKEHGRPASQVVHEVAIVLSDLVLEGIPLVIMNAPYDLTVLDRELERHRFIPLAKRAMREPLVIDPYILDQHVDRYRKGKRTLTALSAHYGVRLDGAHEAAADALAAAKVACEIAERYPAIAELPLPLLHHQQQAWAAEQADRRRQYFASIGRDASTVHGHWPFNPRQRGDQ